MSGSTAHQQVEPFTEERWHQMTIEEAIEVAHRNTGISYQKDDPVMAVVAILNAVDFHRELTRYFHRELTRLLFMERRLRRGQDFGFLPSLSA